ncbi:glyoxalase [Cycloclasticus sp. 44_32_T64]|nr:glyoxalase [Cycloclasticus sp. 44_32_T64]
MNKHEKISYVEFPAKNLQATKEFFTQVFGWSFQDFGAEYTAFSNQGIDGGFFKSELSSSTNNGAALIVFYSNNLELTLENIIRADGHIIKPIFPFPGGRRFHFTEPSGNEFAVWSDKTDLTKTPS